jgi:DNA-binding NarL/FixJ family response regulator
MKEADPAGQDIVNKVLARRYFWALALALLSALLVFILFFQRARAHLREEGLQHAFEEATGEAILRTEELERALAGIHAQIEQEFDAWNLTVAEREVALLLLKGLRLKEIADARGTSERTVRQQAQAVYKKAGLEGRSELAAFFIEDFMQSMDLNARQSGK